MKFRLKDGELEAWQVTEEGLLELVVALRVFAPDQWSINWARDVGFIIQVSEGGVRTTATTGEWLARIGDQFWQIDDDLFQQIVVEPVVDTVELPTSVWVPTSDPAVLRQTPISCLPVEVGGNQMLGWYTEGREAPHGVKGFPLSFFPVKDADPEARLLAPRVAKYLGFDHLLGMVRLLEKGESPAPDHLARFWFIACDKYGRSIKEDK